MDRPRHHPQRSCLGCGARAEQAELIRLAVTPDGRLIVSRDAGRGGYLHRRDTCWHQFVARKSHFRAFRVEVSRAAKENLVKELQDRDRE
jgi:predicted RNA-binding protein YlxR (DUF448 family)